MQCAQQPQALRISNEECDNEAPNIAPLSLTVVKYGYTYHQVWVCL